MVPAPLELLIRQLARLPGLGPRSAQRVALQLVTNPQKMADLQASLADIAAQVTTCTVCGNVGLTSPCHICTDEARDTSVICVVEQVDDLWALEKSRAFSGLYHVLGGVVNALDGIGPEDLNLKSLRQRIETHPPQEVVLALSASMDGQTTAHLIAQQLAPTGITVTSLARGVPVGASVDYLDDGTLTLAFNGRQKVA